MIFSNNPTDWKDLQNKVALILQQCGFMVETPKKLSSVRSEIIEVDVYAVDESSVIKQMIICECKHWDNKVPQSVVHAFRAQLEDLGANLGLLISKNGFQSGSYSASRYTNIKLLTWREFEDLFFPKWYETYFLKEAGTLGDELFDIFEPYNSSVLKKVNLLTQTDRIKFKKLKEKYHHLGLLCLDLYSDYCIRSNKTFYGETVTFRKYCLPFDEYYNPEHLRNFPQDIIEATSYFQLLELLKVNINLAVSEFNELFTVTNNR